MSMLKTHANFQMLKDRPMCASHEELGAITHHMVGMVIFIAQHKQMEF